MFKVMLAIGAPVACFIIAAIGFMGVPPHPGVGWGFAFLGVVVVLIEGVGLQQLWDGSGNREIRPVRDVP